MSNELRKKVVKSSFAFQSFHKIDPLCISKQCDHICSRVKVNYVEIRAKIEEREIEREKGRRKGILNRTGRRHAQNVEKKTLEKQIA